MPTAVYIPTGSKKCGGSKCVPFMWVGVGGGGGGGCIGKWSSYRPVLSGKSLDYCDDTRSHENKLLNFHVILHHHNYYDQRFSC